MMATTYEAIATVTVGSGGAANIQFTSIPSTYTDLVLVTSSRASSGASYFDIDFNSSGSESYKAIQGTGSAVSSFGAATGMFARLNPSTYTANTFDNNFIYITNYASSSAYKAVSIDSVTENNATASYTLLEAGLYESNTAISSITLTPSTNNFAQYSTATLYGIKNS